MENGKKRIAKYTKDSISSAYDGSYLAAWKYFSNETRIEYWCQEISKNHVILPLINAITYIKTKKLRVRKYGSDERYHLFYK